MQPMKASLIILFSLFLFSASNAQNNLDPVQSVTDLPWFHKSTALRKTTRHVKEDPLFVYFSHAKEVLRDSNSTTLSSLDPKIIKKVAILKDSVAVNKYGKDARKGVVEIYLDDEKYPDAYKTLHKSILLKPE